MSTSTIVAAILGRNVFNDYEERDRERNVKLLVFGDTHLLHSMFIL